MEGIWLVSQLKQFGIKLKSLRINGVSRNSHKCKQGSNSYKDVLMIDNTSKASCGYRNPAQRIDKYLLRHSSSYAGSNPDPAFIFYELFVSSCFN